MLMVPGSVDTTVLVVNVDVRGVVRDPETAITDSLARRRALLTAALGFLEIRWRGCTPDAAAALARGCTRGPGSVPMLAGMQAQGFDVELKQFPGAWRATFYPTGVAHSIVMGSAQEPTPWRAVQRTAWAALEQRA